MKWNEQQQKNTFEHSQTFIYENIVVGFHIPKCVIEAELANMGMDKEGKAFVRLTYIYMRQNHIQLFSPIICLLLEIYKIIQ